MEKLGDPSQELATRILTEVGFENRLIGFKLRQRAGAIPVTIYTFEEVVSLLNDPNPRLDLSELEMWVRDTMGDKELADQIAEAIRKGRSDRDRSHRIKKLLEKRFGQCKKMISVLSDS